MACPGTQFCETVYQDTGGLVTAKVSGSHFPARVWGGGMLVGAGVREVGYEVGGGLGGAAGGGGGGQ